MVKTFVSAPPARRLLLLLGIFALCGAPRVAHAQLHPLVVVFQSAPDIATGGVEATKTGDGLTSDQRSGAGCRAICACFNDSNVVTAFQYHASLSMVKRAIQEANLTIANPTDPTPADRILIGRALKAIYVVTVSTQAPKTLPPGTIEMTVQGADLQSGKLFDDHVRMSAESASRAAPTGDSNAVHKFSGVPEVDNILYSAANTLVVRILGGPLGDFTKSTPPSSLLPKAAPAPAPADPYVPKIAPTTPAPAPGAGDTPALPQVGQPLTSIRRKGRAAQTPSTADSNAPEHPVAADPVPVTAVASRAVTPRNSAADEASAHNDAAKAAIQQASALLGDGNSSAAIMMLRSEINQQPYQASLRLALAQTYLAVHRAADAESEARRALMVLPSVNTATVSPLTPVIQTSSAQAGDPGGVESSYERIIAARPTAYWAQVALAEHKASESKTEEAEALYRSVLKNDPNNAAAAAGLARLLIDRGDVAGAEHELATIGAGGDGATARFAAAEAIFDASASQIASLMARNRAAWEAKNLAQDAFYKATNAEVTRIANLEDLLKKAAPPAGATDADLRGYKVRVYAGSLLAQAANALLGLIQNGDSDSASVATLQLSEFQDELLKAQGK